MVLSESNGEEYSVKETELHPILDNSILQPTEDLLKLNELHESTLLYNIRKRYLEDKIYTYVGPIVVALNPFKKLPVYADEVIRQYHEQGRENMGQLPPHIYTIAESSYYNMLSTGANQSILISGESGAGKTETTKYLMRYLAQISGTARSDDPGKIQTQIMQANPILEAFGNAKTLRNNNSSRFGKFIRIQFDTKGFLTGAEITNYLLEKSRLVQQSTGERTYHIFYQFLAGASPQQREMYNLDTPETFHYLNQSGCTTIEDIDEVADFQEVSNAIEVVGIKSEKEEIFQVLAGILHLGNVSFFQDERKTLATSKVSNLPVLQVASNLLKVKPEPLAYALTTRRNYIRGEVFTVPLSLVEATEARDALAKALYHSLFNWLVDRINKTIYDEVSSAKFIGLLDIFGFEHFKVNSFEQFCINFCNEKLQQHYNRHTFKWEQEACQAEEIDYTKIDFVDNQLCLDLIEKKPLGVLSLLDEECNFPKATDSSYLNKLHLNFSDHSFYEKPRLSRTAFMIKHYAGDVLYESEGFLEKNRDSLPEDIVGIVQSSESAFIRSLLEKSDKKKGKKPTSVGAEFNIQLNLLMALVNSTEPHWIRCIKPNPDKKPDIFAGISVLKQLTCAGVLETIRIRRSGYPLRIPVEDFFKRFKVLYPKSSGKSARLACLALLQQLNLDPRDCQLGLTKVFLKAEQFSELELLRERQIEIPARNIQRVARGWLARLKFKKTRAALRIQKRVRTWLKKVKYQKLRAKAIMLQGMIRGYFVRKDFKVLLQKRKAQRDAEAAASAKEAESEISARAAAEHRAIRAAEVAAIGRTRDGSPDSKSGKPRTSSITPPFQPQSGSLFVLAALTGLIEPGQNISIIQLEQMEAILENALVQVRECKASLNGATPNRPAKQSRALPTPIKQTTSPITTESSVPPTKTIIKSTSIPSKPPTPVPSTEEIPSIPPSQEENISAPPAPVMNETPVSPPEVSEAPAPPEKVSAPPPEAPVEVLTPVTFEPPPPSDPSAITESVDAPSEQISAPAPAVEEQVSAPPPVEEQVSVPPPPSEQEISAPPPVEETSFAPPPPVAEEQVSAPPPLPIAVEETSFVPPPPPVTEESSAPLPPPPAEVIPSSITEESSAPPPLPSEIAPPPSYEEATAPPPPGDAEPPLPPPPPFEEGAISLPPPPVPSKAPSPAVKVTRTLPGQPVLNRTPSNSLLGKKAATPPEKSPFKSVAPPSPNQAPKPRTISTPVPVNSQPPSPLKKVAKPPVQPPQTTPGKQARSLPPPPPSTNLPPPPPPS